MAKGEGRRGLLECRILSGIRYCLGKLSGLWQRGISVGVSGLSDRLLVFEMLFTKVLESTINS